jgi:hypothetical protein
MIRVDATSMSWRVARTIRQEGWAGEVLAVSRDRCYVGDEDGRIVALVHAAAGNGPLHVVLPEAGPAPWGEVASGAPAASTGSTLLLGEGVEIGLDRASLWDPKAYLAAGAGEPEALRRGLVVLHRTVVAHAPSHSLARLLPHLDAEELPEALRSVPHFPRSHALMGGLLESLLRRNHRGLKVVTSSLAGFGPGLTPAADDFLAGLLLALALVRQHREDAETAAIASLLLDTSVPRTHEISAAYLQAAHAGEAGEAWHPLLAAVARGEERDIPPAALRVMALEEPSGADMLAGFLAGASAVLGLSPPELARTRAEEAFPPL